MEIRIQELENENIILKEKIKDLESHLEKYTNNERHKKYYEKNKEQIKENANNYLKKLSEENPEKLKEYRRRAYLKQKEKKQVLEK